MTVCPGGQDRAVFSGFGFQVDLAFNLDLNGPKCVEGRMGDGGEKGVLNILLNITVEK